MTSLIVASECITTMAVAIFIRFTFVGKGNLSLCQWEGPFSSDGRINAIHNQSAFIGRAQLAGKGAKKRCDHCCAGRRI
jgi:hypothetical protein